MVTPKVSIDGDPIGFNFIAMELGLISSGWLSTIEFGEDGVDAPLSACPLVRSLLELLAGTSQLSSMAASSDGFWPG